MSIELSPSQTKQAIKDVLAAGRVPMVQSSPGIGKSSISREIADEFHMLYRDIRLTQKEDVDLDGYPQIVDGRMTSIPTDEFPLKGMDKLPVNKKGWIIGLDEFNSSGQEVQAAA